MKQRPAHPAIFTVGHSNRSLQEFLDLLRAHGIGKIVDIRTIPRSRHNPQFNGDRLARSLRKSGITYVHLKSLGGLRHARKDSVNTAWRNASFRGFADYMQTPEFEAGLERLLAITERKPAAILCAEALPWRCHRSLVADALVARGIPVEHLMTPARRQPHAMTSFASVRDGRVRYPGEPADRSPQIPEDR